MVLSIGSPLHSAAGSPSVQLRSVSQGQVELSYTMPESELPNPIATQAAGAIGISLSESRCSWTIAHPILDISNDVFRSLDIRFKKSKPEGVLENAIANGNIPHGDIATNHSTEGSRARNEGLTDEGIDDDFTDEGLTDEGIADDESTCSTKPIEPGDIKAESLWGREYPINEW
uniref:Uncharacterized protein n=1 Tax=Fusarium oxysporum (strain Fo5176) TaxID=660025 RepID=A0A0C4BKN9_FUSOF